MDNQVSSGLELLKALQHFVVLCKTSECMLFNQIMPSSDYISFFF